MWKAEKKAAPKQQQPVLKRSRPKSNRRAVGPGKNHTYDSNGPDTRVKGTASQVLEKYMAMARDAASTGDRIASENYYQHAEHYQRILHEQETNFQPGPNRNVRKSPKREAPEEVAFSMEDKPLPPEKLKTVS